MTVLKHIIILFSLITSLNTQANELDEGLKMLDKGDFKKAAELFAQSFENKKPDGGFYLGRMFELGVGTKPDIRRSAGIYTTASNMGSHKAANRLAMLYLEGNGVLQDYDKAAKYLQKAAKGGDKEAQFNYGVMFEKGWGVKTDLSKALNWYEKAAEQDHIAAQNIVAIMYKDGKGTKKSEETANEWFAKSANKGNALGLYYLGEYLIKEEENKKPDYEKAYMLFNLSSAGGHPSASNKRNSVAKKLSSDQLKKAQARARKWLESDQKDREVL